MSIFPHSLTQANTRYHIVLIFDNNLKLMTIDKKDVQQLQSESKESAQSPTY